MYYTKREKKTGAEELAGEVGIGGNLIYTFYKAHDFYYEFVICAKVVKKASEIYLKLTLFHYSLPTLNHIMVFLLSRIGCISSPVTGP